MARSGWNFFSYNLPGSWSEDGDTWETYAGNTSWIGYQYDGPSIGSFPLTWCRISATINNLGTTWDSSGTGGFGVGCLLGFSPNILSGTITDTSLLNTVCVRYYVSVNRIYACYQRNGAVNPSYPQVTTYMTPYRSGNPDYKITIEAMLVMNPTFKDLPCKAYPSARGRLWTRYKDESSVWSSWTVLWDSRMWSLSPYNTNLYSDGYLDGFYPWFGAIATDWTSGTAATAEFSNVDVTYGTEK
jgi:hypothetical protein